MINNYFTIRTIALFITFNFILLGSINSQAQEGSTNVTSPCSILRNGWFKMVDVPDTTSYVVVTSSSQTEYYNYKKYWVRSSIQWISDCEATLTVLALNYPGLLCRRGDKMKLRVLNVSGNTVSYEVTVDGKRGTGRYLKMENTPQ